ncbi:hypothetical protein FHU10_2124 [Serratia fonticola]|jgi:hypothetical protein|uniref:Uncharacterized protein n=1 Tax=Serratia fonticola TaxID=47917 RepID=A0A559T4S1_SERFO|nr:hypothetical protein FHU09_0327 [Serratia fonticola]TQI95106.1 hypothetical protein FHU11_0465 [Serratia fonticola]TVZ69604.1 hypothetical protein FHU10_2124 [Serratia fonticola]
MSASRIAIYICLKLAKKNRFVSLCSAKMALCGSPGGIGRERVLC